MKPKAPVWLEGALLRDLRILLCNFNWRWTSQEVKVEDTADDVVLKVLATCGVDLEIHAVRVEEEHAMSAVRATMVVVDWVCTVKISA